jgi:hypothetical protein
VIGKTGDVYNPFTGERIGRVPQAFKLLFLSLRTMSGALDKSEGPVKGKIPGDASASRFPPETLTTKTPESIFYTST